MFYDNYVKLCNSVAKSPSAVALEIGIYKSTVSGWKNRGSLPTDATAQKLADYFGVTVAELMAENEKKPAPEGSELTELQREAMELVKAMSDEQLAVFIATLKASEKG